MSRAAAPGTRGGLVAWWPAGAGALALALLFLAVRCGLVVPLDQAVLTGMGGWARARPAALAAFRAATIVGDPAERLAITATAALVFWAFGRARIALFLIAAQLGGWLACTIIKTIVERPRPTLLEQLDKVATFSFPSAHAWNAMTLYGGLAVAAAAIVPPRVRPFVFIAGLTTAALIGLSRVALGVHWPSDVVGGWCGGLTTLALCHRLVLVDPVVVAGGRRR